MKKFLMEDFLLTCSWNSVTAKPSSVMCTESEQVTLFCAFGFTSFKDWQMRNEKIRYQLPIAGINYLRSPPS
jgi:hypothetical protein